MAKLVSRLRIIADGAEQAVAEALEETANFILMLIRLFAPVDTGRLRDSYEIQKITPLHILIGSMVNYAVYQEYGTGRQAGTPHVTPAFILGREYFKQAVIRKLLQLK